MPNALTFDEFAPKLEESQLADIQVQLGEILAADA